MWDSNLRPAGQCSDPRDTKKCSRLGHLGISGPTYCITSCSSVVRALVCQLNGPGSILAVPFKSAITKGKTQLAAVNHHHSIVITCLCCRVPAPFPMNWCGLLTNDLRNYLCPMPIIIFHSCPQSRSSLRPCNPTPQIPPETLQPTPLALLYTSFQKIKVFVT